jgi:hypothetical protein
MSLSLQAVSKSNETERIYVGGLEPDRLTVAQVLSRMRQIEGLEIVSFDDVSHTKADHLGTFFFVEARTKPNQQIKTDTLDEGVEGSGEIDPEQPQEIKAQAIAATRSMPSAFDILASRYHNVKWRGCRLKIEHAKPHILAILSNERIERQQLRLREQDDNLKHSPLSTYDKINEWAAGRPKKQQRELRIRRRRGEEAVCVDTKPQRTTVGCRSDRFKQASSLISRKRGLHIVFDDNDDNPDASSPPQVWNRSMLNEQAQNTTFRVETTVVAYEWSDSDEGGGDNEEDFKIEDVVESNREGSRLPGREAYEYRLPDENDEDKRPHCDVVESKDSLTCGDGSKNDFAEQNISGSRAPNAGFKTALPPSPEFETLEQHRSDEIEEVERISKEEQPQAAKEENDDSDCPKVCIEDGFKSKESPSFKWSSDDTPSCPPFAKEAGEELEHLENDVENNIGILASLFPAWKTSEMAANKLDRETASSSKVPLMMQRYDPSSHSGQQCKFEVGNYQSNEERVSKENASENSEDCDMDEGNSYIEPPVKDVDENKGYEVYEEKKLEGIFREQALRLGESQEKPLFGFLENNNSCQVVVSEKKPEELGAGFNFNFRSFCEAHEKKSDSGKKDHTKIAKIHAVQTEEEEGAQRSQGLIPAASFLKQMGEHYFLLNEGSQSGKARTEAEFGAWLDEKRTLKADWKKKRKNALNNFKAKF